ncbi:MAG: nucleotidyl transferase AbiEii/AbiGii toxin family protein [Ginsengibacter sp.]
MQLPALNDFNLVGGTALALYYGHRLSVDLDLFSATPFANEDIIPVLSENLKGFNYRNASNPVGLFCRIGNTKVDFIKHHHHPLFDECLLIDGIRMLSPREIMAMKVAAILKRGVKKDFWDLNELFKHFTVQECIASYKKKYPTQELLISIPYALTYFADADESEEPISLKGQTWASIKKTIQKKINEYLK